jgi:hypothetical protein
MIIHFHANGTELFGTWGRGKEFGEGKKVFDLFLIISIFFFFEPSQKPSPPKNLLNSLIKPVTQTF